MECASIMMLLFIEEKLHGMTAQDIDDVNFLTNSAPGELKWATYFTCMWSSVRKFVMSQFCNSICKIGRKTMNVTINSITFY